MDTKNKIFVVIGSVALLASAGIGGVYLFAKQDTAAPTVTPTSSSIATSTPSVSTGSTMTDAATTSDTSSYKDGTYTASTNYSVPHGATNSISATVVVSGGKITSVKTTDNYTDHESAMYVGDFENSVSSDASGQSLGSYSPSRIGGASLTTEAFASVLDTIRTQAKA